MESPVRMYSALCVIMNMLGLSVFFLFIRFMLALFIKEIIAMLSYLFYRPNVQILLGHIIYKCQTQ